MLGFPILENLYDFSIATRLSQKIIYNFSKNSKYYYKTFEIPKSNGGARLIAQPCIELKTLQAWILRHILQDLKVSSSSKGFEKQSSILNNALPHKGASAILTIDLENFYTNIRSNCIFTIFKSLGYNAFISSVFTSICTFNGGLPQGGPCSPKLSNLVCLKLDSRLQGYVGKRNIVYTRYADDLSFSALTTNRLIKAYKTIKKIIEDENFIINQNKTRIAGPSRRKKVTSLIISDDIVGIGRLKLRFMRSKLHHLCIDKHVNMEDVYHTKGWLSFIKSVDKKRLHSLQNYCIKLKDKYPNSLIKHI